MILFASEDGMRRDVHQHLEVAGGTAALPGRTFAADPHLLPVGDTPAGTRMRCTRSCRPLPWQTGHGSSMI